MLLRYVILSLVGDEEMHGYRIKSIFEKQLGRTWPLNFGQIYSSLKDMKRREMVAGRLESNGSHMGRWVYQSTPRGRRSLATWLARKPRPPVPPRHEILVRLLAASGEGIEASMAQLGNEEDVYRVYLDGLKKQRRTITSEATRARADETFAKLAVDAAIYQAEAHLRWIRHCGRTLKRVASDSKPAIKERPATPPERRRQCRVEDVPAARRQTA